MAWIFNIALEVDRRIGEVPVCLATAALKRIRQLRCTASHPETAASTAAHGLYGDREADPVGHGKRIVHGIHRFRCSGNDRYASLDCDSPCLNLVAHQPDCVWRRSHKNETCLPNHSGE